MDMGAGGGDQTEKLTILFHRHNYESNYILYAKSQTYVISKKDGLLRNMKY